MHRLVSLRVPAAVLTLVLGASGAAACSGDDGKPDIVVTTNILGDVVTRLVGDTAEVRVLMKPNADPHSFGISAKEAGEVENADLVVANGLGLEEGLGSILDNARSEGVEVLEVGELVDPLYYADSGAKDPHFWTDPARMVEATGIIEGKLTDELDGDEANRVREAAASYRSELEQLDAEVAELLGSVPEDDRKLVTNHHVFGYLADRFNYRVIGAVIPGGTTLASPSAADLRDLSTTIRDNHVPAIFADSSQPQRLAEVLAQEVGVDVEVVALFSESLTEPDGEAGNYIDIQRTNAERISDALTPR
ncbi:MAG: metal ABC transporter substrate-binding protein [Corynebacterium variabile]|uniref:metal ABC transporter substrate-binding protein n=1 Tax=Corynebacterium variabile TaxID=1727 RepID=UPI0026473FDB|nr:metal ABC transporter substrate-binding protein [Corynebacterium variabile]MDN6537749.1 metal ABC transporter substrate-binding protein [Corynebacterium variabile]